MLPRLIAIPATISTTAIMNVASLIPTTTTTTKEFTENTGNIVTASAQQQVKEEEALGTNDI